MKLLTIDQPWATLVATGIMDIINLSHPVEVAGLTLIAAGKPAYAELWNRLPAELFSVMGNHLTMGNIPPIEAMPSGVIIGIANIGDAIDPTRRIESIWGGGKAMLHVEEAWTLPKPVLLPAAVPYDVVEYNELDPEVIASAQKVTLRKATVEGTKLQLPLSNAEYDALMAQRGGNMLRLNYYDEELYDIFCPTGGNELRSFAIVEVTAADGRQATFTCDDCHIDTFIASSGKPIKIPSIWSTDLVPDNCFTLTLTKRR